MKFTFLILIISFLLFLSCEHKTKFNNLEIVQHKKKENDYNHKTVLRIPNDFADSAINQFIIKNYDLNQLEHDSINVAYFRNENCNFKDKIYVCFQIGLNLKYRFQTNENIYVDIKNKKLFEYDPINDSLIPLK